MFTEVFTTGDVEKYVCIHGYVTLNPVVVRLVDCIALCLFGSVALCLFGSTAICLFGSMALCLFGSTALCLL